MKKSFAFALTLTVILSACKHDKTDNGNGTSTPPTITASTEIKGYNLLSKICGIWNGPITSTTVMGSFPEAPFDFRPISAAQVAMKNELDSANSLYMSFFIVWTGSEYQVAFRNGGNFSGMLRTAYMKLDSVYETSDYSYYRFVDFKKGKSRTITEVSFWNDSLHIRAYTNKSNTQPTATVHMDYRAGLQYSEAYTNAKNAFSFPQKEMVKNFAHAFDSVTEAVLYVEAQDPYPASAQPYVGKATLSYNIAPSISIPNGTKVMLLVSTQPLINQSGAIPANFVTRSRYVALYQPQRTFLFTQMHPGSYYLYAFVDVNNDGIVGSGDYVSYSGTQFSLAANGTVAATALLNLQVP